MKNYDTFFTAIDHRDQHTLEAVLIQNRGDIPSYVLAVGLNRAIDANLPAAVQTLIDAGASTRIIETFSLHRVVMEERKDVYAILRAANVEFINAAPMGGAHALQFRQAQRYLDGEIARDKMALEIAALKEEILSLKGNSADAACDVALPAAKSTAKAPQALG
jgi:hypothetical protein